ncbi:hypothetical protein F5X96DRAFT_686968 [Biscogniauxia mediterranea]|nr:hypothetical protein F5X96DRAFT_686968 [Biscogniauxia mediterranea]
MPPRNAPAPRRGPPFAHKRGAQPTSGARAMTSEWVDYGWSVQLSRDITRRVERVQGEANSAYVLQIRRDRPVDAFSVRNALFWEHRKLPDPRLVSTPATDVFCFFAGEEPEDDDAYRATMQDVRRRRGGGGGELRVHPLFGPMRDREFTVWPVEFDGGAWCTLVLRVRPREGGTSGGIGGNDSFADREVVDMAVVDPLPQGRDARRRILQRRLPTILAQGCIALRTGAVRVHDARAPDVVAGAWETGYVAYAVAREVLRRLKVLTWRRREAGGRGRNKNDDYGVRELVFGPWEEYYDVDAYRQHMLAGCAHQTVERSDYRVRLCMEVPSDGSMYDPEALSHRPAADAPPDERFSYIFPRGENPDPVIVQVVGAGTRQQQPLLAAAAKVPSPSPPVVIKQEIPDGEDEYYEYGAGAGAAVPRQPSVLAPYDAGQGVYMEVPGGGGGDGNDDVAMRDTSVAPVAAVVAPTPNLPASVADQQIIEISDDEGDDDEEEQYMPAPRGQAPGALMMNPGRPILGFGPLPPIVPLAEAETGTITFGAPMDDGEFSDQFGDDDDDDDDDDDSMVEAEQVDLFAAPEPGFSRNAAYQFTPASATTGMGIPAKRAREGDDSDDAASAKKIRYEGCVEID